MTAPASRRTIALLAGIIALVTIVAFLPSLQNGFVSWDDDKNFLTNPAYRGLGFAQLRWMWSTFHLGHYVPVSWMTLGFDYALWGMDARGYHLTSLLLHATNAIVVFFVARRLLAIAFAARDDDASIAAGAAFAALWFAVHPLRVESVAWVTERRDVLSGLLYSLTVLLYLRAVASTDLNRRRYWAAVAVFAMALLSKATAMTLPAVLVLMNVYPLRRLSRDTANIRRVAIEVVPFAALSAGAMIVSLIALDPGEQLGVLDKVGLSAFGLAFYLWKSVVPVGLAAYYPLPLELRLDAPMFFAAYATLAALAALAWKFVGRWPGAAVAMLAFGVIVLPMLGVVQNGPQLAADRYTYHAAPALALVAGGAFILIWRWRRVVAATAAIAIIGALGALTWRQTQFWHDSYALWTRVLAVSDDAAIAHNALGNLLMGQERTSLAIGHYERATRLDPTLASAQDNLGVALARLGRASEALEHFERAVASKDEAGKAWANWGVVLLQQNDPAGAVDKFSKSAAVDPNNANTESNWGSAYARAGLTDSAIAHFKRATEIQPSHAQAHFNWGTMLARTGKWDEATAHLETAVSLDSTDADARANLARVRAEKARGAARPSGRAP